jgi:hypothetical protein
MINIDFDDSGADPEVAAQIEGRQESNRWIALFATFPWTSVLSG